MARYRFRFVNLGPRDGFFIQSVYEAVAYFVGRGEKLPTLIFVYPSRPYVCIGVNQLPDLEVDLEYCRSRGIDVVRRQVGGGAVYLDENQQFYHIIMPRNHPLAQGTIEDVFRRVLQAIVCFYKSYGLNAEYKPVNDVVVNGRKASGNGAALLHNAMVVIGNVIMDFDANTAARVLRVPDEKLRSHLVSSMREWVTSLRRELGNVPPRSEIVEKLRKCFEETLGLELVEDTLSEEELELTKRIVERMRSREWLYALGEEREYLLQRYSPTLRIVKIREGHYIVYAEHRSYRTYRCVAEIIERKLSRIAISTDSFTVSTDELKKFMDCLENREVASLSDEVKECVSIIGSESDRNDLVHLIEKLLNTIETVV